MKITKRQLRKIIKEEKAAILAERLQRLGRASRRQQLHNRRRVDEAGLDSIKQGLNKASEFVGDALTPIQNMMKSATDFAEGVRTFLEANSDWIEPVYDVVVDLMEKKGK